jgi:hypothetical protein
MIEQEHSHIHQKIHSWAELTIACSAILISLISLFVSVRHGHTMEKLVEANEKQVKASTLPLLRYGAGNMEENQPVVQLHVINGGTGPALVSWLRILWNGAPVKGPQDLLDKCCAKGRHVALNSYVDIISGNTLPAGRTQNIWSMPKANNDVQIWQALSDQRNKIAAEACFCSVLEDCWKTRFENSPPQPVKECEAIDPAERW